MLAGAALRGEQAAIDAAAQGPRPDQKVPLHAPSHEEFDDKTVSFVSSVPPAGQAVQPFTCDKNQEHRWQGCRV